MSISSQVGELQQPLNKSLKETCTKTITACYRLIFARKRRRKEGGGTKQRTVGLRLHVQFVRLLSEIKRLYTEQSTA